MNASPQLDVLEAALPPGQGPQAAHGLRWLPVRTLNADQREQVLEHLLALDSGDRSLRFGHPASDAQIRRYVAQLDFVHDEVFGVFDRKLCLIALAHLAFAADGLTAEFGVSVLRRHRGRGFGKRLFEHTVMHARNRGVSTLVLYVEPANLAMLEIVKRAGAEVQIEADQAVARLPLASHSLASRVGALIETHAAEFDYQLKMQTRRLDQS